MMVYVFIWVNHQIRPWIFTRRPTPSLNYAKYQLSPWICQTSIKKVPPSKCSISHAVLSCTRGKKEATCSGTNLIKLKKVVEFSLFSLFFSAFPIFPLHYPYLLLHISEHQKRPWPFFFPLKLPPFSPLQNHHHLRRSDVFEVCVFGCD